MLYLVINIHILQKATLQRQQTLALLQSKPLMRKVTTSRRYLSHLFCTLISENQGPEKLRSFSNLRKISGPAHLNFFSVDLSFFFSLSPEFFSVLRYKSEKKSGDKLKKRSGLLKKNSGVQDLKFF